MQHQNIYVTRARFCSKYRKLSGGLLQQAALPNTTNPSKGDLVMLDAIQIITGSNCFCSEEVREDLIRALEIYSDEINRLVRRGASVAKIEDT